MHENRICFYICLPHKPLSVVFFTRHQSIGNMAKLYIIVTHAACTIIYILRQCSQLYDIQDVIRYDAYYARGKYNIKNAFILYRISIGQCCMC